MFLYLHIVIINTIHSVAYHKGKLLISLVLEDLLVSPYSHYKTMFVLRSMQHASLTHSNHLVLSSGIDRKLLSQA